jgi:hypothetical protein
LVQKIRTISARVTGVLRAFEWTWSIFTSARHGASRALKSIAMHNYRAKPDPNNVPRSESPSSLDKTVQLNPNSRSHASGNRSGTGPPFGDCRRAAAYSLHSDVPTPSSQWAGNLSELAPGRHPAYLARDLTEHLFHSSNETIRLSTVSMRTRLALTMPEDRVMQEVGED